MPRGLRAVSRRRASGATRTRPVDFTGAEAVLPGAGAGGDSGHLPQGGCQYRGRFTCPAPSRRPADPARMHDDGPAEMDDVRPERAAGDELRARALGRARDDRRRHRARARRSAQALPARRDVGRRGCPGAERRATRREHERAGRGGAADARRAADAVSPAPRRILVTGGAVGIGAATARALAPDNRLLIHYHRSRGAAESLAESLAGIAVDVHLARADLTTDRGCNELHEAARTHLGALDVLVNNAGGMIERQSVGELTWRHLVDTFALNALSTMRLTSLCRSLLGGAERACVVNVTSIAVRHGAPSATAYGAAKAAVDAFTRGAAKELAPIRVNAVAPGMIDTAFHDRVTSKALMRQFVEATPLRCLGTPEMVARTIKFVVENEFMTGETVDCNGGLFMR